jgi:hypothetical protein
MRQQSLVRPASLVGMRRSELGALFRHGSAGEVPVGRGQGTALVGLGGPVARLVATLTRLLLWQGKVIDPDRASLRNLVSPLRIRAIKAKIYRAPSWFDNRECIVLDYSTTSLVARKIRDEIREVAPGVYLGLVFWGRRHVVDFALDFSSRNSSSRAG